MSDTRERRSLALRLILGIGALLLIGVVIGAALLHKTPPAEAAPIQARLDLAAGDVTVNGARAVSGTALLAEAKLATGKGARALVRLPDGSSLFLRDGTSLALEGDHVALAKGEYWLDAPPTDRKAIVHQIGDVSITAAESGLSVRRESDKIVVYVARGRATVTGKGGRVEVHAGERATVKGEAAPVVAALSFWDDWTGGLADYRAGRGIAGAGSGTIYGVDVGAPAGAPARRLEISRQVVRATVRDGLAETRVDQTFFNPGERDVEGWYWFTIPDRASVTGFSVETDGKLVDGELIERKQAAAGYAAARDTGHAPAILEWIDSHTYRARIFPVPAGGTRRVVLRYVEMRPAADGRLEYVYPMGSGEPVRIGEFALSVDLGDAGTKMKLATLADARIEQGGRLVTMRRSGYTPRAPFQLEAKLFDSRPPMTLARFAAGGDSADYVLARYTPDVDWSKVPEPRGDVVVVVDTSAAGDEASRQLETQTAEAILRALSDSDRFALVSLDVKPTVLHPAKGLAPASDKEIQKALEALADHASGGATDLASMFDVSLGRLHGAEQPAVVYVGDGIATSGVMGGEKLVERLRRALDTSPARLFTVAVGTDADGALLAELARAGGGAAFHVDEAEQTTSTALRLAAALKIPTITDLNIDLGAGLDDAFESASGKVSRGQDVTVLARTHHDLPSRVKVTGRLGGKPFEKTYPVETDKSVLASYVPRLWAAEYVRRLLGEESGPEGERGRIVALGLEYGLMTPYTSFLALESEQAYQEMNIKRAHSPLRGVELGALDPASERALAARVGGAPPIAVAFGCDSASAVGARSDEPAPVATAPVATAPAAAPPVQGESKPSPAPGAAADVPYPTAEARQLAAAPSRPSLGGLAMQHKAAGRAAPAPPAEQAVKLGGLGALAAKMKAAPAARGLADDAAIPQVIAPPAPAPSTCSDAAARPLAERVLLWKRRLANARSPEALMALYHATTRGCELPDWRAERTFLELLQAQVDSEGGVTYVLGALSARPEVQKFVAKLILRRSVAPRMVAAVERVLFGSGTNWNNVDLELAGIKDVDKRIARLREIVAAAPEDPEGAIRLVKLLVGADHKDEALAIGRRLRDDGLLTPHIAEELGDVLARAGLAEEAVRTYSGIVEFDPGSIASRKLLGDIYLGHGWYEPAYRQYLTLTEAAPGDALGWLRLAAAAAGTGRTDEALRLERKVATAQGNPGPTDPRRWARLESAARLARLLAHPDTAPGVDPERRAHSIERELKQLALFNGPGTLVIASWEQLDADLLLVAESGDKKDVALGDATDAAPAGLSAMALATGDAASASFVMRLRSTPRDHAVAVRRTDITWDGKRFDVKLGEETLAAGETSVAL